VVIVCQGAKMKIKNIKKITDLRHLNLFSVSYEDRENSNKQWVFASRSEVSNPIAQEHNLPDAVVIVPYHKFNKKLVLIKEFRVVLGGYQYGFPAGLLDKGESVEEAGKRELFEETGLAVTRVIKKSPSVFSSSGMTDESVCLLYVECDGDASNRFNEASEDIEVIMVAQEKALELLNDNTIKFDVKTWIVLNSFAAGGMI
jgi:ADP-ribose pyrophosphatase